MSQTDDTQSQGQDPVEGQENPDSAAQRDAALAHQSPRPNVVLARGRRPITVDGPINIGTITVEVGSEAQQRAGFYTEHVEHLIQQFPGVYKRKLGASASVQGQPSVEEVFDEAQKGVTNAG